MLAPGISGNATAHGAYATVDTPFSKIWENLQFGGMARPTVRYRRWAVSTDVIYMGLGAAKSGLDVGYDQWLVESPEGAPVPASGNGGTLWWARTFVCR